MSASYREVKVGVSRKVAYRRGDSVSFRDGRFTRYGTVQAILERTPDNPNRAVTYYARLRVTHEVKVVSLGRLSPAPEALS